MSIAQTLMRGESDENKSKVVLIAEKLKLSMSLLAKAELKEVDFDAALAELVRRMSHFMPADTTMKDNTGHVDWLTPERKAGWRYWERLARHLERKLASTVVDQLDKSTDEILELLEDPKREGSWDRRGLVVGHVQSGKTSSYSALICKAADAGYKIIIVLAGLHNNLRSQTQIRLEEAFLGYETSPNREPGKPIGVYWEDSDPTIHPHCATTREEGGDFNTAIAKHFAISPEERPWLFVVKKNKTVLGRLLKWIQGHHVSNTTDPVTGRRIVTNLPLLVIDDEADHASVDTGEQLFSADGVPDDDHQPKAINGLIRKILYSFSKSAYVGYTATPFANIFIHRRNETKDEGPDLFPQSFIKNLSAPSNYVGPARVFGLKGPNGRVGGLPLARDISDQVDKLDGKPLATGWMLPKHKKDHIPVYAGQEILPPSLREAIESFVLACVARACRGQGAEHSSMLIHVTRYNRVQLEVHRQVEEYVKRMKQRISRRVDHEATLASYKRLWDDDFVPTCEAMAQVVQEDGGPQKIPSWDEIAEQLPKTLAEIHIRKITGTAKDTLDYFENKDKGLKVIAIGGEKLSRGLTLEGLCSSYFVRTTKMYDTLMQMGRWFGYRPGYIDLCRLYTTQELVDWFGHIADASEELREEFDTMAAQGAKPSEYGLRVESHPVMLVTSPLKMRTARTLKLSYSGSLAQTITFLTDEETLEGNLDAAKALVAQMGKPTEEHPARKRDQKAESWKRSLLWKDVGSDAVLEFLRSYKTVPGLSRINSSIITEFIEKMNSLQPAHLTRWNIALLAEGPAGKPFAFANDVVVSTFPGRINTGGKDAYRIGVLTDPADEAIDFEYEQWKAALEKTKETWKVDPARNRSEKEHEAPSGKQIRNARMAGAVGLPAPGLLMLYPLAPSGAGEAVPEGWDRPIMAFAISFPSTEGGDGVKVEYKVDHLYWEKEYGASE
ncbi:Z1 domain-containing protein [Thiomonas sp. X19]|uniref:Z1 domain-containing protein n=1 Tax=Thiomonas sp. X19 TaxID=1050370 RepID=UPI001E5CD04E|nr:Z1 domain-containing protein [Thiomonas sp. X19]